MSPADDTRPVLPELRRISDTERRRHRELVLRHVDFLVKSLAADQELRPRAPSIGCPTATPENVARRREDDGSFPCLYTEVYRYRSRDSPPVNSKYDSECACGDPLASSDDPLDSVAAVALASGDRTMADRYVSRRWRAVVSALRDQVGSWEEIQQLTREELEAEVSDARGCAIASKRVGRLFDLLEQIAEDDRFEGVTMKGLPTRPYPSFRDLLSSLRGVSDSDAWWLLLTAFDKPVWPSDPDIDRLLCDLGLLSPDAIGRGGRHESVEDALVDRQIPALHRALAGHAARGTDHFGSESCEVRKFSLTFRSRQQARHASNDRPVAVDMFAGAGGISHGLLQAEYDIALAVDKDQYATDTYRLNHPEIPHERTRCADIEELLERDGWQDLVSQEPDIMVGGPPCQSLSQAGYRSRRADDSSYSIRDDPRTDLYTRYLEAVVDLQPRALIIENVEGMANEIGDTDERVVDQVIADLEALGENGGTSYVADFETIDCSRYGIPQTRNRIIIVGIRGDLVHEGIDPESFFESLKEHSIADGEDPYNLKQGLSGLPRLCCDEGDDVVIGRGRGPRSEYVDENDLDARTDLSFNHRSREHPMEKDRKLFDVMDPGDTGWYIKYRKESGKWSHLIDYDVGTEENPAFTDKYRMIHWDEPAPTVVAHFAKDTNNYIIPDYYEYANRDEDRIDPARNRGVTPREAARLQSFPDNYIFLGPFTKQFRQIGNAVPPLLSQHLGEVLKEVVLDGPSADARNTVERRATASSDD